MDLVFLDLVIIMTLFKDLKHLKNFNTTVTLPF